MPFRRTSVRVLLESDLHLLLVRQLLLIRWQSEKPVPRFRRETNPEPRRRADRLSFDISRTHESESYAGRCPVEADGVEVLLSFQWSFVAFLLLRCDR